MIGATVFRNNGLNRFEFLELNQDDMENCDAQVMAWNRERMAFSLAAAQTIVDDFKKSLVPDGSKTQWADAVLRIGIALFDKRSVASFTVMQTAFKRKYHELKNADKNGHASVQEQEGQGHATEPLEV